MSDIKVIDKRWGFIGDNTSDNDVDSSNVAPNAEGSILERLEELDQNIANGIGQKILLKTITNPANAGSIDIGTVSDGPVFVEAILLKTYSNTTSDYTSGAITGGTSGDPTVLDFIDSIASAYANLDTNGQQVAWLGKVHLEVTDKIVQVLSGTGATAVNFKVVVVYRAVDGATGTIS